MKTLRILCWLAAAVLSTPALAQKFALVRDVDGVGNASMTTVGCDIVPGEGCGFLGGPSVGQRFILTYISYKLRFTAATKVTSVHYGCGTSIDYLPLGTVAQDDNGNVEISWGGVVRFPFSGGCTGFAGYERSGPEANHFVIRLHGYFAGPLP
jgi:hypothetical protein